MISVVIPSNRCDQWLEDSIDSVLKSVCNVDFEVLLILNNLSISSLAQLPKLKSKYGTLIKCFILEKATLVDALNLGIENAKWELIARLDSDDTMTEYRLQNQFDFLLRNQEVALVGSAVSLMNMDSEIFGSQYYPEHDYQIKCCMRFGNFLAHPSVMFRKSAFNFVGGYSEDFTHSEDFDLFSRFSRHFKLANIPERLTNYRIFENQISSRYVDIQEHNSLAIIAREYQHRNQKNRFAFLIESGLLKARYAKVRGSWGSKFVLTVWLLVGLFFNFRPTLEYVRQFFSNSISKR